MKKNRITTDYIVDILDTIDKIAVFTRGLDAEDFSSDEKTFFAVIRGLEIIGEAVKQVPDSVREKYPDIPWALIAGMRDKLIHAYFGVDSEIVWVTATVDIPNLKLQIEKLLEDIKE